MSGGNPFNKPATSAFADPSVTQHTGAEDEAGYDVPAATGGGAWGSGRAGTAKWAADPPHARGSVSSIKKWGNASSPQNIAADAAARSYEANLDQLPPSAPQRPQAPPAGAKNFPKCYPIVYHDIEAEIPAELRFLIRMLFYSYLLFVVTLCFNFFATLIGLADGGDFVGCIIAAVFMVVGVPAAWLLWYGRIYNAAAKDRAITYMCFFLNYGIHIGFCAWGSFAPPVGLGGGDSFAGIWVMSKRWDEVWVGVIFLIATVLWLTCAFMGAVLWSQMMKTFRGQGGVQQAQNEAKKAAGKAAVSQAVRV